MTERKPGPGSKGEGPARPAKDSGDAGERPPARKAARQARLAAALRENLHRRKRRKPPD